MTVLRELFASVGLKADMAGFKKVDAAIGSIKTALIGLGVSFGVRELYKGMMELVDGTANAAFEANRAAQRVGITREAFEELSFAAHHTGVSAESMELALRHLNLSIFQSRRGGGEAGMAFRRMGIDIGHGSRSAASVMGDLAERFKKMPDGPEKTALAMRFFGRAGTDMIPMLNKGREGIAELREEAHKAGMVFGDEDVVAAQDYKKASLELHSALESLKRTIGVPLLHLFAENKRALTEWIEKNRALIRDKVVEWVRGFVQVLKTFFQVAHGAAEMASSIAKGLWEVSKNSEAARVAIIALGLGIALAIAPGTTAIMGLLFLLDDMYGWMTHKYKGHTIFGDMLGPFEEFKKDPLGGIGDAVTRGLTSLYGGFFKLFDLKPEDSTFMKGLKTLLHIVTDLQGAWLELERAFEQGKLFRLLTKWAVGINEATIGASPEGLMMKGLVAAMPESMKKRGPEDEAVTDAVGALTPTLFKVALAASTGMTAGPAESAISLPSWAGPPTTEAGRPGMSPVPTIPYLPGPAQEAAGPTFNFTFGDIVTSSPADFTKQVVEQHVKRALRQEYSEAHAAGTK